MKLETSLTYTLEFEKPPSGRRGFYSDYESLEFLRSVQRTQGRQCPSNLKGIYSNPYSWELIATDGDRTHVVSGELISQFTQEVGSKRLKLTKLSPKRVVFEEIQGEHMDYLFSLHSLDNAGEEIRLSSYISSEEVRRFIPEGYDLPEKYLQEANPSLRFTNLYIDDSAISLMAYENGIETRAFFLPKGKRFDLSPRTETR